MLFYFHCFLCEQLQQQVDRLAKLNQNLHQKNELIQSHAQSLMKEKSQIMTEMKAMEKENPSQTLTFDPKEDPAETQTQEVRDEMSAILHCPFKYLNFCSCLWCFFCFLALICLIQKVFLLMA